MHKSLHIENLRNISQSMPGESDGFHANPKYCAIPMSGSAGLIAIIQVNFSTVLCFCLQISVFACFLSVYIFCHNVFLLLPYGIIEIIVGGQLCV